MYKCCKTCAPIQHATIITDRILSLKYYTCSELPVFSIYISHNVLVEELEHQRNTVGKHQVLTCELELES